MRRSGLATAILLLAAMHRTAAQEMLSTAKDAEAEAVAHARGQAPVRVASVFTARFTGTAERRCVTPPDGVLPAVTPPRSGEFVIRYGWLHTSHAEKMLWMPLHNPGDFPGKLLLRAVRLGHPADSLRLATDNWGWVPAPGGARTESAFITTLRWPVAGTWLVVATAGDDWGCFELTVDDS